MNIFNSMIKYLSFSISLLVLFTSTALAIPADAGPYKIGYAEYVVIDTSRNTNQINKPGEPNGRRMILSIYYPIDNDVAQNGIPMMYKFEWASDINPSGTLPLATVKTMAGNLTYPSKYGALVDSSSTLPPDSSLVNCNTMDCTDGHVVGLPVSKNGPFPLLINALPGTGVSGKLSVYAEMLATYGFIVVSTSHMGGRFADVASGVSCSLGGQFPCNGLLGRDRANDVIFEITSMITKNNTPSDPFYGKIDIDKIGAFGYSAGAGGVTAAAGGVPPLVLKDPRIKAMALGGGGGFITSAPFQSPETFDIPNLWFIGTADNTATTIDAYNLMDTKLTGSKYLLQIKGMTHLALDNACDIFGQRILDLQKNGSIKPADKSTFLTYMNFRGVKVGGFQTFCDASLFYEASNNVALAAIMAPQSLSDILFPPELIPGRLVANIYEPTTPETITGPLIKKYLLAFFKVHLSDDPTYKSDLIPGNAHAKDKGVTLDQCDQKNDTVAACKSSIPGENSIINDNENI